MVFLVNADVDHVAAAFEAMQDVFDTMGHTGNGLSHGGQPLGADQLLFQPFDLPEILKEGHYAHFLVLLTKDGA